jgi:branched-chain amino acid transport system ATP-binding protein
MLEIEGATKYFGGMAAVMNVDFQVKRGEIVGLIGPNGAGKTTLFNLISGDLRVSSGIIRYKGQKISGKKPYQICRLGVARTFQLVKVFNNIPVFQNVLLGALFGQSKSVTTAQAAAQTAELLNFVGLANVSDTPAKDLTLVNQKRLEVARALATKPELLLLDELMAGLNSTEITEAMELVRKIRDRGITVFMIEHVMKAIMSICDRIIVLHHGNKIAEGTPQEITSSKKVIEVYLGEGELAYAGTDQG